MMEGIPRLDYIQGSAREIRFLCQKMKLTRASIATITLTHSDDDVRGEMFTLWYWKV